MGKTYYGWTETEIHAALHMGSTDNIPWGDVLAFLADQQKVA